MLSAHYFYILSCSVYVSRGLINYNLLHKQEGKKTHSIYLYSIIFFIIFGGWGRVNLFVYKQGWLLCVSVRTLRDAKASLLLCLPHQPLTLQWTGLQSQRQSGAFAVCTSGCASSGLAGQTQPLLSPDSVQRDKLLLLPPGAHGLCGRQQNQLWPLSASRGQLKCPALLCVPCPGCLLCLWGHLSLSTMVKPPQVPANRVRFIEMLLGSLKPRVEKL